MDICEFFSSITFNVAASGLKVSKYFDSYDPNN
jgi:hypothetical protein